MPKTFNYGGQAVIEGVMMRGSRHMAVAVRAPDHSIVIHKQPISSALYNGIWSKVPFVRGLGLLWDSLGLGTRALMYSANVAAGEEADFSGPVSWITFLISGLFAIALFFLTPRLAADGANLLAGGTTPLVGNLIEGLVRLTLVIGYIWIIGKVPEIQRVFAYHGAEHKTINAYEAGAPLTPEEVAKFPLEHPRCGTGFLLVVVVFSVIVFSLAGDPPPVIRYSLRIILIPVIAAIAYEYIKLLARHSHNAVVKVLIWPQLALQRLTTRQPDSSMLEVGITALKTVLESEEIPA
jgi:uncharacterized protein YqhQ